MKTYIPTINISSLLDGKFVSKEAKKTIQSIKKACVEVGFFQITGHGISLKEINLVMFVINFSILQKLIKKNYLPKNGIKKIKIYTEDTFQMM